VQPFPETEDDAPANPRGEGAHQEQVAQKASVTKQYTTMSSAGRPPLPVLRRLAKALRAGDEPGMNLFHRTTKATLTPFP
jgi:hypothetical protein